MVYSKKIGLCLLLGALVSCQSGPERVTPVDALATLSMDLEDMQGTQHALDALLAKGQPVALVFWQTWCASCVEEAPVLARAARDYEGEIQFFGVVSGPDSSVDEERIDELVRVLEIPYPQVRDRDLSLTLGFGVQATPTIILLGADRKVLYRGHEAPKDWDVFLLGA